MTTISFSPEAIREYARHMPSWFNPEWATYLTETATETELTMIGDGIADDDELWYLVNRLIAKHAQDHFQSVIDGNVEDSEDEYDEDSEEGCGKWGCRDCYPDEE